MYGSVSAPQDLILIVSFVEDGDITSSLTAGLLVPIPTLPSESITNSALSRLASPIGKSPEVSPIPSPILSPTGSTTISKNVDVPPASLALSLIPFTLSSEVVDWNLAIKSSGPAETPSLQSGDIVPIPTLPLPLIDIATFSVVSPPLPNAELVNKIPPSGLSVLLPSNFSKTKKSKLLAS